MRYVMVLNDGETYTNLEGCAIVAVPDEVTPDEEEVFIRAAYLRDAPPIVTTFSERG